MAIYTMQNYSMLSAKPLDAKRVMTYNQWGGDNTEYPGQMYYDPNTGWFRIYGKDVNAKETSYSSKPVFSMSVDGVYLATDDIEILNWGTGPEIYMNHNGIYTSINNGSLQLSDGNCIIEAGSTSISSEVSKYIFGNSNQIVSNNNNKLITMYGTGLKANNPTTNQFIIGKYNDINSSASFIIGNGTDNTHRHNIIDVYDDSITIHEPIIFYDNETTPIDAGSLLDWLIDIKGTDCVSYYDNGFTHGNETTVGTKGFKIDSAPEYTELTTSSETRYTFNWTTVSMPIGLTENSYIFIYRPGGNTNAWEAKVTEVNSKTITFIMSKDAKINKFPLPSSFYTSLPNNPYYISVKELPSIGESVLPYNYANAEGHSTAASGDYSHAEGRGTTASGNYSHAEGAATTATGYYSHAEGGATTASGDYSHTEGTINTATGHSSHAEGRGTTASGNYSHAEGHNTTASGNSSHAEGYSTAATGYYSHAEGRDTTASGNYSHAEGYSTAASGDYSHAEGNTNTATGHSSHAEGAATTATGYYSHAEGAVTTASGNSSHAEGYSTAASGNYSHAEGRGTTASGNYSHAEGYSTAASGDYSHAEGNTNTATGHSSHAEGGGTTASGNYSHAEGAVTTASGNSSHAEGHNTTASGDYSHAEGRGTTASGNYSHAEGGYTITAEGATYQHVEGRYNVADATKALIIGNGTADNDRSNAVTVDWNGNVEIFGNLSVTGSVSGVTNDRYYAIKIDLGTSNISNVVEIPENALIENIAIVINTAYSDIAQTVTITQSNGTSSKTIVSALNIGNVPNIYNNLLYTQSIGGNISVATSGGSTTGSATIYLRVVDVVIDAG